MTVTLVLKLQFSDLLTSIWYMFLKATKDLRVRVVELKNMYGFGIKALDNLAEELKSNNQLTYEDLKSEVAKHSSALEDVSGLLSLE
jgi:kinesin family member 11